MAKALAKRRRRERTDRDDRVLAGDRHPRAAAAAGLHHAERFRAITASCRATSPPADERGDDGGAAALLHLQAAVLDDPSLLRPAVLPSCADVNFAKRTELADLRGRVALLTGGRVKIGYQAGLKLLRCGRAPDRHDALSARLGGALRAGAGLRRLGRSARDLRPRPCATRRASRRSAASCWRRAIRLDFIVNNACQTVRRPPDFYAHMMARRDGAARAGCPSRCGSCWRRTRHCAARMARGRGLTVSERRCRMAQARRRGAAVAGAAAAGGDARAARALSRRPARSGPAAGRPARGATPGACCWPKCRRSSCSKCSWSTPSRRSSSTRGSSR